ncbi:MAG: hypothetical protein ABH821_04860 [archaeon]
MQVKYFITGISLSIAFFLLFGVVTNLIPNSLFNRMIETTVLDYFFLVTSSVLLGSYVAVHLYKKNTAKKCDAVTYSGGVGSFLAFGCPICNKLLVILFGATTLITYFEPYRPVLGFVSIVLLVGALYWVIKK